MNKMNLILTSLSIYLLALTTVLSAEEIRGEIETESGKICPFVQYPPKQGDLFNRGEILPVISVWFEDLSCMEDTEVNRTRVLDQVARLHGIQDAGYLSHAPQVTRQFHGDCFTSTQNPSRAVNIYYLYDHEFIQGFVHSLPGGTACTIPDEVAGPGGARGMGAAMGMGMGGQP